jgi:cobalt-precorrin-5B (C1)-methyltransferase
MRTARKESSAMRYGYTTGACAAAAAHAATTALLRQEPVHEVTIDLLDESKATFTISRCTFSRSKALCSVIKDAGDDPDITDGAEIQATVRRTDTPSVTITGGKGVGVVTKPGLEIPQGMAAINPVPRKMIEHAVMKAMGTTADNRGIEVVVSVPEGERLARRTLNARLGITGGISILGTTGIVIPYSVNAYTTCISQSLDVAVACGYNHVVLTTGRRSEKFAQSELALADECFVQVGDFIGFALEECARRPLAMITVWGMIGKVSKLAAGNLYTNVSHSRIDIGFIAGVAASSGIPQETVEKLSSAVTANHLRKMLPAHYVTKLCDRLCTLAAGKCREAVGGKIEVECIITDNNGVILGRAHDKG